MRLGIKDQHKVFDRGRRAKGQWGVSVAGGLGSLPGRVLANHVRPHVEDEPDEDDAEDSHWGRWRMGGGSDQMSQREATRMMPFMKSMTSWRSNWLETFWKKSAQPPGVRSTFALHNPILSSSPPLLSSRHAPVTSAVWARRESEKEVHEFFPEKEVLGVVGNGESSLIALCAASRQFAQWSAYAHRSDVWCAIRHRIYQ